MRGGQQSLEVSCSCFEGSTHGVISSVLVDGMSCRMSSGSEFRPEVFQRLLQANSARNLWLPLENHSCFGDVGLTNFWIVLRKRFVENFAFSPGESNDFFGKVEDGDFIWVPEIHGVIVFTHEESVYSFNEIVDVANAACLTSIAEHRNILTAKCLGDERWDGSTIINPHPWAVRIENAGNTGIDPMISAVCHRHRLSEAFRLVVHAANANGVNVPPVMFRLWVEKRIAVDL